jgi:O-acetyl-ADP-ribose deacetylase (regulator of RNase III)
VPRIELIRGDLTRQHVDAIVNAANSSLLGGGGVDGAIHRAGGPAILEECRELRRTVLPDGLPTGEAVATGAGRLPARWVVHTVGPVWPGAGPEASARRLQLASAHRNSLAVAEDLGATGVAFPAISAGVYGWPVDDVAAVALEVAGSWPDRGGLEHVTFVLFSDRALTAYREAAVRLGVEVG